MALGADAKAPRVVVVSDVRLYREGLAVALGARDEVCLTGTAESLAQARALIADHGCDVVLLDAGMPHALGIARELMLAAPSVRIVAVAVADDATDIVACAQAGLDGYITRDASINDVAAAIHGAMRGELRCSPMVAAALFKRLAALGPVADAADRSLLTTREEEVVELIDRGLSNKEIAQRLRIGLATVKNHVHNVLDKLQVSRRAEAAARLRGRPSAAASGTPSLRRDPASVPERMDQP